MWLLVIHDTFVHTSWSQQPADAVSSNLPPGGDGVSESDGDNGGGFDDLPDGDNASFDGGDGGEDNGTQQIEA